MTFDEQQMQDTQTERPIETASGTTSPQNAKSGNVAYAIAVVAIAASLSMGLVLRGCTRLVTGFIEDEYRAHEGSDYEQLLQEYLDDDYYLDDHVYTDGENGRPDADPNVPSAQDGTLEVKNVLGMSLALYDDTIDTLLAASDYANAQRTVSESVRALVLADRDASAELARSLRAASWEDGSPREAIESARTRALEVAEQLRGIEAPEVSGEHADQVAESFAAGRDKAVERWEAIAAEMELLAQQDTAATSEVELADEKVYEAARAAAESLSAALRVSVQ